MGAISEPQERGLEAFATLLVSWMVVHMKPPTLFFQQLRSSQ